MYQGTARTRLIDNVVAAEIGAQQLVAIAKGEILNKSSTTNVALLLQNEDKSTSETLPEMGKFPRNGHVADISLLAAIYDKLEKNSQNTTTTTLLQKLIHQNDSSSKIFHTPEIKKLFPIAENNHCINFGSFGCSPLPITLCQSLYQNIVIDSDSDNFLRSEVYKRLRDVRRALADYIKLENENEIFLVDNAGEAMNVALSSLMFNPTFLQYQTQQKMSRKAVATTSSSPVVFKILMLTNTYPMVQECVDFHMNRLRALARFSSAFGTTASTSSSNNNNSNDFVLPYSIEVVKIPLTREMVYSLKQIPVACAKTNNYYDYSSLLDKKNGDPTLPLFISAVVNEVLSGDYSCLILDHVMFSPSLITPIDEISRRIKIAAPETLIIVDGAHAIGSVRLDFSMNGTLMSGSSYCAASSSSSKNNNNNNNSFHVAREHTPDVFLSNCHKWLGAPKSSAILYCKSELHPFMHPSVISNMHRGDDDAVKMLSSSSVPAEKTRGGNYVLCCDKTSCERLHTEFLWKGTRDPSNFLCLVDLLWLRYKLTSSQDDTAWIESNRKMALEGAKKMSEIWSAYSNDEKIEVILEDVPAALSSMVTVKYPITDKELLSKAINYSQEYFTNFLATAYLEGCDIPYCRISAQVYSTLEDFEYAAKKFLEALEKVKKSENTKMN